MRVLKSIWVIFDPLDGPHLFKSSKEAWKTYRKWGRDAKNSPNDSFWDTQFTPPIEYKKTNK